MSSNKMDHEYSMARSQLSTIEKAVKRLKSKMKGEGNIEAWVQSKITKAADYIDTAADYLESGEHSVEEAWKMPEKIDPKDLRKSKRSANVRKLSQQGATPGEQSAAEGKRKEPRMPLVRKGDTSIRNINAGYEPSLVDKILEEIAEEKKGLWANIHARRKKGLPKKKPGQKGYPETLDIEEGLKKARKNVGASKCWTGYKATGTKIKDGEEVPDCKKEDVTIEDANGNTFAEVIDLIKPDPITKEVQEAVRLPAKTGNIVMVNLTWKGKYIGIKIFFPYTKIPNRSDVQAEIEKVYPGGRVYSFQVSDYKPGETLVRVSEEKKNLNDPIRTPGENKKFKVHVKDPKTGNVNTVRFGDPNMEIKRDDPKRLKAFRSRHGCDTPAAKDKTTAKYWSCYQWRKGSKVDN